MRLESEGFVDVAHRSGINFLFSERFHYCCQFIYQAQRCAVTFTRLLCSLMVLVSNVTLSLPVVAEGIFLANGAQSAAAYCDSTSGIYYLTSRLH